MWATTPRPGARAATRPASSADRWSGRCGRYHLAEMAVAPDVIVDVSGSGRERGRAHGELLRDRIGESLERWDAEVAARMGIPAAYHVAGLLGATRFLP